MKAVLLVGWLLLAMSAHTLLAVLAVFVTAPIVYAATRRLGGAR